MGQLTRQDTVKLLAAVVEEILCNANLLGQYNLIQGTQILETVPAIKTEYPRKSDDIQRSIVPESGIEAIIYPEPDVILHHLASNNFRSHKFYMIVLDQHNPPRS